MAYVMNMGSKPIGELYLTPIPGEEAESDDFYLMAHFYSGGDVRLIKFKKPLESPEEGSPEDRIRKLEQRVYYLSQYTEYWVKTFCGAHGIPFQDIQAMVGTFPAYPEYIEEETDLDYLVQNYELYLGKRGC
jgi:hypothetical protein